MVGVRIDVARRGGRVKKSSRDSNDSMTTPTLVTPGHTLVRCLKL